MVSLSSSEEKLEVAQEVRNLLASHPDTQDVEEGEYELQYRTDIAQVGIKFNSLDLYNNRI